MPNKRPNWQARPAPDLLPVSAVSQAIDLAQTPRLAESMRRGLLPRDMLTVIRLASRCQETATAVSKSTARDPGDLQATAELYLRQVVCFRGADPHRTLGVSRTASLDQTRRHMRQLVVWLHPDSNPSGGDPALMQRVIEAWHILQSQSAGDRIARTPHTVPRGSRSRPLYRPMWVSQPLPKAASRFTLSPRLRIGMRSVIVLCCLVVPDFSVLFVLPGTILMVPADDVGRPDDAPHTEPPSDLR